MDFSTSLGLNRPAQRTGIPASPTAPTALGNLSDRVFEQGVAIASVDVSVDFTGIGIGYALAQSSDPLPAGLSLSADGVLSGTPSESVTAATIVIRGTNAQGSADSAFSLTVQEMLLDFTATIVGLSPNPTHGDCAQSGVSLTAEPTGFTGTAPSSIMYQWATVESGPIVGATQAEYVPDANALDLETLYCTITPTGYPSKETNGYVIRYAPPTAAGALWDEIVDLGSGPELFAVSGDFTGEALSFSVTGPGTSIDAATGLLTIETDSPVAGAVVSVAAMNSGGTALSAFSLTVEDAGIGPGPDLAPPVLNEAANTIDLTVDVDCTIYWRRDATGTNPDAAMVMAGGGYDGGSFAVAQGTNAVMISFAEGHDGLQEISFVAAVIPAEPSLVQTVAIDIDSTDPLLESSLPPAGAGGVSNDVTPVLTFTEPIAAGSGTVTLQDVTSGTALEVFDVATGLGPGPGQIEISGANLTIRPSASLSVGRDYALLIEPGAIDDLAGNSFAGITSTATLGFSVGAPPVIETDFGTTFPAEFPTVWALMQANPYNASVEHRPTEDWGGYATSVTDGGVIGVKSGSYPQLRFSVPVEIGKTYAIDADLPVGEGNWTGPLRVKIGSAINQSDYALIDDSQANQPRVVEIRGLQIAATSADLWFAIIVETNGGGAIGGNPALSMLRITEA